LKKFSLLFGPTLRHQESIRPVIQEPTISKIACPPVSYCHPIFKFFCAKRDISCARSTDGAGVAEKTTLRKGQRLTPLLGRALEDMSCGIESGDG
jgi:hypothetical protein